MKRFALITAAIGIAALGTAPAVADEKTAEGEKFKGGDETEFRGSCELDGRVFYPERKLRDEQQELVIDVRADARCEGTLDGEEQSFDAVLRAFASDEEFSCGPGDQINSIKGELNPEPSAGDDEENNIAVEFTSAPNPVLEMELEGRNGGSASGPYTLKDNPDPAELIVRCAGDGNEIVEFQGEIDTGSGSISG